MSNLTHALAYRKRGWSIIPIKPGDKLPAISSWTKYQTTLPTDGEIKQWFAKTPNAGIALICGQISGVIAVDIDIKSGGKETAKTLNLPITLVSKTGSGGSHYLYQWRKGLVSPKVGLYPGIDIRSDKSYIVLPPSLHKSGNLYEWANEGEELAPAPAWLEATNPHNTEHEKTDWDEFFKSKKVWGTQNNDATKFAGKIMHDTSPELWDVFGVSVFKEWNNRYCTPPLPEKELMTVWNSIKKTHLKNIKPVPKEEHAEVIEEIESGIIANPEEDEKSVVDMFSKNATKGTYYMAKYLTGKYSIVTVGEKEREMFVYRDGVYFRAENEIIFPEIQRILCDKVTKSSKAEAFHKIADMTSSPRSIFESAPVQFIPLANGVYDMENKKLLPHSSSYRFTYQFPIIYDAKAECPKSIAFMKQVLTEDQFETVQEWLGYYFYRLYSFKKAVIFVGEGDTGKTTLLEVIMHLLGKENISSVSLHKMTSDKFAAAHLYEKHGNLVDELSAKDITDTGNFKIATGGGSISGEYKFGNQFSFQNFSKFTFACNKIPDVTDFDDEAYFNRWMVIRFEKHLEKKIPNFIKTLTTEEERSGLFNFAMEGLKRLLDNGAFSYAKNAMDTKLEMMRSGSSIAMFAASKVDQDNGAEITKEEMYDNYTKYCGENNIAAETMKMFGTKFPFYVTYVSDGLITDHKSGRPVRVRGWRNVKIVNDENTESDNAFNTI